jgi:exonuclease SbcC
MRAIELDLEGFTSFRSHQNLSFSNLDLFAITGPTGAGKTSILDAITFALYGHVARFGKDAKASELASQGKDNLKVSFRFSVRNSEYRVTRTWRKRPKTDKIDVFLDELKNDKWEKLETNDTGVKNRVKQILGMDFDTFTRVILLPQGKFDEFIKGNKTKRREILRDLAGFEIFEKMRKQANEQATSLKKEYEILERQQSDLQLPTEAEFTDKKQELTSIEQQVPILNEKVLKAQKALDEAEELFQNLTRLASLQKDFSQLLAKTADIENFKMRLEQAQAADQIKGQYTLVKAAIDADKKAQAHTLAVKTRLKQAQQKLEQHKKNLAQVIAEQQQIEPQLKTREEALNSAKNYDEQLKQQQLELARYQKNQKQRQDNLTLAKQALNKFLSQLQAATKQAEENEKVLKKYSPGGERLQQLQQVTPLLTNWKLVQEQTVKSRQKLEQTTSEKQKAEKTYQDAVVKLEQAKLSLQETEKILKDAEQANHLSTQNNHAAALRQILHDGDNCPVCNGTYLEVQLLPLAEISLVDTSELQKQKDAAETTQKTAENSVTKAETNLDNLKKQEVVLSQELAETEAHLRQLKQQAMEILQTDLLEVDVFNQELKTLQENDKKYHEALAKQKDATVLVDKAKQAQDSAINTENTALSEYETATQEVQRWQQQVQQVETKLHALTAGKSYSALQAELEKEKQALEQKIQVANQAEKASEKNLIQCETEYQEASKSAEAARIHKEQTQTAWELALVSAGFTEVSFLAVQVEPKQLASWKQEIDRYTKEKVKLETQVEEVKRSVGTRTTDASTIASLKQGKKTAEQEYQQAQTQRTNVIVWIQNAESKRKQAEQIESNLSSVKQQAETYAILARNLKTDEFQAHILEYLETELVTRATNVLQELTDSRYSLEIQDGDYWVADNWNGGDSRRVQTLSGGETFATSLSMALALSEKLSMGAELGSLFLDEGFGTLDAETLETVHQILESLRQQDKLIGVITHVKALGERLPQVKVNKSPEGSKIEVEVF